MTLYDNFIAFFVLFVLAVVFYCKVMEKTLPELVAEMKEIFSPAEEVAEGGVNIVR